MYYSNAKTNVTLCNSEKKPLTKSIEIGTKIDYPKDDNCFLVKKGKTYYFKLTNIFFMDFLKVSYKRVTDNLISSEWSILNGRNISNKSGAISVELGMDTFV